MAGQTRRKRRMVFGAAALAAVAVGVAVGPDALAQSRAEKRIDPVALPLDKAESWTLHFRYKPPRIVTLDGLDSTGKPAKKVVWYMWYQVYNLSGEPQTCLPEFELVTKDLNTAHLDQPEPYIVEQLGAIENPTGQKQLQLLTTIGISKRPIPVTKPDSIPVVVTGVAVWTDMAEKAPKTNKFSVYITGLSNGLAVEETPTGEKLIKRKTLQINFLRPTDDNKPQVNDIVPDDLNGPAERWIYRTVSSVKPKAP
jgi:hypothetical protein